MSTNVTTKERPAAAPVKPMTRLKRRLLALRGIYTVPLGFVRTYFRKVGDFPAWQFVAVVGLAVALLKAAVTPLSGLLSRLLLEPLGSSGIFASGPILALSDSITTVLYEAPLPYLGWASLSTLSQLTFLAIAFAALATLIAQHLPLLTLRRYVSSQGWRITISVAAMGVLYLLSWGDYASLFTGAVIGLPLTFTYLHWRRRVSTRGAFLITGGVHATANAVVILYQLLFGGI